MLTIEELDVMINDVKDKIASSRAGRSGLSKGSSLYSQQVKNEKNYKSRLDYLMSVRMYLESDPKEENVKASYDFFKKTMEKYDANIKRLTDQNVPNSLISKYKKEVDYANLVKKIDNLKFVLNI